MAAADTLKVVDASAIVALLFAEAQAAQVADRLAGTDLIAPALLDFELANVCLTKMRRDPPRRVGYLAAYHGRAALRIGICEVDQGRALELAERTGLSGYDASYLWLARTLGAELVTLDQKLATAARAR
ncbi:MAG: type II toxin-antitoxin system VapC family toxin [Acetobacteraceae bacterium]